MSAFEGRGRFWGRFQLAKRVQSRRRAARIGQKESQLLGFGISMTISDHSRLLWEFTLWLLDTLEATTAEGIEESTCNIILAFAAACTGSLRRLKEWLAEGIDLGTTRESYGATMLHHAVMGRQLRTLELLWKQLKYCDKKELVTSLPSKYSDRQSAMETSRTTFLVYRGF